jgi:SAM-dependent methyltransferase
MNVDQVAANLKLGDHGIWFSRNRSEVSYPSSGNNTCYQIEDASFWFRHRNHCIVAGVHGFPPAGAIFDIGGGNGFVSQGLQSAGWDTVVMEPGVAGAMNARRRGLANVICSTLEDAEFQAYSIPAIGLFDVLEHVEDDEGFLLTAQDRLIRGGRIYITVPAYPWLWSAEDVFAGHFRRYTLSSLTSRLNRAGFHIEFASYIFSLLPLPILLRRTIPSKLGLRQAEGEDDAAREHGAPSGALQRIMDRAFAWELRALECQRPIRFGGSCLVVASSRRD